MTSGSDPSAIRPEVAQMQARAAVCNALMGGTQAMRLEGAKYLPQEHFEDSEEWAARMAKTTLFPAFKDAVDSMTGKPLGKPILLEGVAPSIEDALEDADLAGRDLDSFARAWFRQSLVDGIGWVLVDYPRVPQGATLKQERDIGARPYLVHIPLVAVCGWKTEIVGGVLRLTQFRWKEIAEEADGEFGTKTVKRIKVWEPGEVRAYVMVEGEWTLDAESSGPVTIDYIPIVCFAPGRTGYFTAVPPLEELAWLNILHWQSSSDQRNILHYARSPVFAADNLPEELPRDKDGNPVVKIGPSNMFIGYKNLRYVEHSGAAIGAGRQDLGDLEARMSVIAGRVLTRENGPDSSATESALKAKDGSSKLRQWAWDFQDRLEEVLIYMAAWTGEAMPQGIVKLSDEWDERLEPAFLATALQARTAGQISQRTWLYIAQKYDMLPNGVTIDDEISQLGAEGPEPLGASIDRIPLSQGRANAI